MSIIRPRVWTQQPQVPVEVDWGNPLTRKLRSAWTPMFNRHKITAINGGSQIRPGINAVAFSNSGLSLSGASSPGFDTVVNASTSSGERTVLAVFSSDDAPSSSGYGTPFQTDYIGFSYHHANSAFQNVFQAQNGVGTWYVAKYPTPAANKVNVWVGTQKDTGYVKAYSDGILNEQTLFATGGLNTTASTFRINSRSGGYNFNGKGYLFAVWDRELSAAEVKRLSDNPWQIFSPRVT